MTVVVRYANIIHAKDDSSRTIMLEDNMRKVTLQPSERILMEELWEENPQTITQLFHTLNEKRDWTKSTVSTMLNRMSKKGLLRFEQGRKAKLYFPGE